MNPKHAHRILWYESIGFVALMALSWLDELIGLPTILFGGPPHQADLRESCLEMTVIAIVGIITIAVTRRILSRLAYLESYLRVCAWCKKVYDNNQWVPMEEFLQAKFETRTTHGMCPECAEKMSGTVSAPR
jgi:hypothetical protein